MVRAEGHNGQVTFDGNLIIIERNGFKARATVGKGSKMIPVAQVTAVQLKPAGGMANGYIQFTVPGGIEQRARAGKQTFDATSDENSVLFTKRQADDFDALYRAVLGAISARYAAPAAAPAASAYPPPPPPPPAVPAGWYPDPHRLAAQRYWDGTAWTEHTA